MAELFLDGQKAFTVEPIEARREYPRRLQLQIGGKKLIVKQDGIYLCGSWTEPDTQVISFDTGKVNDFFPRMELDDLTYTFWKAIAEHAEAESITLADKKELEMSRQEMTMLRETVHNLGDENRRLRELANKLSVETAKLYKEADDKRWKNSANSN